MKRPANILRYLLATLFLCVATGIALRFLQPPAPPLDAQEFLISITAAGYIWPTVSIVFFISAILLFFNRMVGLALILPIPIFFNFVLYHLFLDPSIIHAGRGLLLIALHLSCLYFHRERFRGLFYRS